MRGLLLVTLAASAAAQAPMLVARSAVLAAAPKPHEPKDTYGLIAASPRKVYATSSLLVVFATALQLVTPGWLQGVLSGGSTSGVGSFAISTAAWLQSTRKSHPLAMVRAHGIVTKACADGLAQTIPKQDSVKVWIDPLRVFRSMLASVLSTSLPFYYWTKMMPKIFSGYKPFLLAHTSGVLQKVLASGPMTTLLKSVVTQSLFRPLNVAWFLLFQSVFRGDSARAVVSLFRKKFRQSVIGGVVFYFFSNVLMYSVPIHFLHPIMGSLAGLVFNVWLAIVAYKKG